MGRSHRKASSTALLPSAEVGFTRSIRGCATTELLHLISTCITLKCLYWPLRNSISLENKTNLWKKLFPSALPTSVHSVNLPSFAFTQSLWKSLWTQDFRSVSCLMGTKVRYIRQAFVYSSNLSPTFKQINRQAIWPNLETSCKKGLEL